MLWNIFCKCQNRWISYLCDHSNSVANFGPFFLTLGLLVPLTKYRLSTDQLLKKSMQSLSLKMRLESQRNPRNSQYSLEPVTADVSHLDPFLTTKSVCQLIDNDVMAVVGVNLGHLDQQIASILSYVGVPFLQINPSLQWENAYTKFNTSLNLYPSRKILAEVKKFENSWQHCCKIIMSNRHFSDLSPHWLRLILQLFPDGYWGRWQPQMGVPHDFLFTRPGHHFVAIFQITWIYTTSFRQNTRICFWPTVAEDPSQRET